MSIIFEAPELGGTAGQRKLGILVKFFNTGMPVRVCAQLDILISDLTLKLRHLILSIEPITAAVGIPLKRF